MARPTIYTRGRVFKEFKSLKNKMARNKDIIYLGSLVRGKSYSKYRVSEWIKEFKEDEEIKTIYRYIKGELETRAVEKGLNLKGVNPFFLFFMKNAYGWKDKTETDHNINLPTPILGSSSPLKEIESPNKSPLKYVQTATGAYEQQKPADNMANNIEAETVKTGV